MITSRGWEVRISDYDQLQTEESEKFTNCPEAVITNKTIIILAPGCEILQETLSIMIY